MSVCGAAGILGLFLATVCAEQVDRAASGDSPPGAALLVAAEYRLGTVPVGSRRLGMRRPSGVFRSVCGVSPEVQVSALIHLADDYQLGQGETGYNTNVSRGARR